MKLRFFSTLFSLLIFTSAIASAKLSMPAIFGDNMVLQRNTDVAIYGTANPGARVTVKVSWQPKSIRAKADEAGKWRVDVATGEAATGQSVEIKSGNTLVFDNVCLGEIWICSGQSNMARLLGGRSGGPIRNGFSILKQSNRPDIRLYQLPNLSAATPQSENPSEWLVSDAETAADFSAVGYIFGKELNDYLGVPIGLIQNAWGGSCVEAWISKDMLRTLGKTEENNYYLKQSADQSVNTGPNHEPSALFNGMLHPLIPYTIRGALWYQGEANTVNTHEYAGLLSGMVTDWRERWGIGDFPFYIVQLAPYEYPEGRDNSALLREAQVQVPEMIPNAATAVILDLGEEHDIHPGHKIPVGERLAILALANTYAVKGFPKGCPTYQSMVVERNRIRVQFKNSGGGLYFDGEQVNELEIAGADQVFLPAEAQVTSNGELLVSSDKIEKPVAVRYGFQHWVVGNLFSVNGLPVSSFRTDDWDQ